MKKRSYKTFKEEDFIAEIQNTDFSAVTNEDDIEIAAEKFSEIHGKVLDNHAPIKIFQSRKYYAPWLSSETKEMIKQRNELKTSSMTSNEPEILMAFKRVRNKITNRLKYEKTNYYKDKFQRENMSTKEVWKTSYEYLAPHTKYTKYYLVCLVIICMSMTMAD